MKKSPYEEMYYLLASTIVNTEELLQEVSVTVSNMPDDLKNKAQISAGLLTSQIYAAMEQLSTALAKAETILLDATDE